MDTRKKILQGQVVSDKMDKTRVVAVVSRKLHPLYKKYVKTVKRVKIHDEKNDSRMGDTVSFIECRHLSKDKCWRLLNIVERAK